MHQQQKLGHVPGGAAPSPKRGGRAPRPQQAHGIRRRRALLAALLIVSALPGLSAAVPVSDEKALWMPPATVRIVTPQVVPEWALMQRHLIETMDRAAGEFYRTYVLPSGELRWKERYEGGMNSSDDAYEAFRGFSLHHVLGGSKELDTMHRHAWEGITKQFTRYGQIYREFDSNWDWMHHGEGYVSLYPLGMADPYDDRFRERSLRFAAMYIGEDEEAANFDSRTGLMRATMNGSRGPKMAWTKRDWIPTNANLVYYHLPYDDIPGVDSPTGWINDHPDDDQFGRIVQTMSDRMAKGDVPINLTAAPLIANAFLYTGDSKYRRWLTGYLGKWIALTEANDGITPDNVGLSGKIGEYMGGNWWGGYYGWKWPRGGMDIVLATLTAAKSAVLLTGERHWLKLPRSQAMVLRERGEIRDGTPVVPVRYDDKRGWHHFVREIAHPYVHLWHLSQSEEDWAPIERLARHLPPQGQARDDDLRWALFLHGEHPRFPIEAMQADLRLISSRLERILNESGDPETWFDAHWLSLDPLPTHNLVRLTVGGLPVHRRGEMLHSYLRYFDPDRLEPGLPQGVAALVTGLGPEHVDLEVVNTNLFERRRMIIQGGAYGEHSITSVTVRGAGESDGGTASLPGAVDIEGGLVGIELLPGCGASLRVSLDRYTGSPHYSFPWGQQEDAVR